MGDRANIVVKQNGPEGAAGFIYLYTHWGGHELPKIAQRALVAARPRWDDEQYFTRIVFDTLLDGNRGETGGRNASA